MTAGQLFTIISFLGGRGVAGPFIRVYSSIDQGDVNSLHKHNSFSHPWTSLPMGNFICKLYNVQLTQIYVGKFYNVQPTGIIFCKLSKGQQTATEIFFLVNLTMWNINLFTMCTYKNCGVQLLTINPFLGRVGVPSPSAFLASWRVLWQGNKAIAPMGKTS